MNLQAVVISGRASDGLPTQVSRSHAIANPRTTKNH